VKLFTMSDLPGLHATATRLILALREGIERLEACEVDAVQMFVS
jgi:hypothetical protein